MIVNPSVLKNQHFSIFTARKRSLRRLCFYTCLSFCPQGGHAWLLGGHAWLLGGACMVASEGACMVALGVCMVAPGGMHGCSWGACMVALGGGMHGFFWGSVHGFCLGVCACFFLGGVHRIRRDTVNERSVRILLECILVQINGQL